MAFTDKWATPEAIASALTTELNALANVTLSAESAAIDNLTGLYPFVALQLDVTYGSAPAAGGYVAVFIEPSLDDSVYATPHQDFLGPNALAFFPLRAVTSQQIITIRDVLIPPFKFKLVLYNAAGQAMPASGTTLKYRRYYTQGV
jgi:hypothetical protein